VMRSSTGRAKVTAAAQAARAPAGRGGLAAAAVAASRRVRWCERTPGCPGLVAPLRARYCTRCLLQNGPGIRMRPYVLMTAGSRVVCSVCQHRPPPPPTLLQVDDHIFLSSTNPKTGPAPSSAYTKPSWTRSVRGDCGDLRVWPLHQVSAGFVALQTTYSVAITSGVALGRSEWPGPASDTVGWWRSSVLRMSRRSRGDGQPYRLITNHCNIICASRRLLRCAGPAARYPTSHACGFGPQQFPDNNASAVAAACHLPLAPPACRRSPRPTSSRPWHSQLATPWGAATHRRG
jgi:hypothetical protein